MKFFDNQPLNVHYRNFSAKIVDGMKVARCKFRIPAITSKDVGIPAGLRTSVKQFEENQFDATKGLALTVPERNLDFAPAPGLRPDMRFQNVTLSDFTLSRAENGDSQLDFQADLTADKSNYEWFWKLGNEVVLTISEAQPDLPGIEPEEKPDAAAKPKKDGTKKAKE